MKNTIYASREMSHFLLGKSNWWEDRIRSDLKAPGFLRFGIDALLLFDTIALDPSARPSRLLSDEVRDSPEAFQALVRQNVVTSATISTAEYERLKEEALTDLGKCLYLLPPEVLASWGSRFHYDYLLESPWWLFVREVDLTTAKSLGAMGKDTQIARGLIPFLYSAIWSLKMSHAMEIPALVSTIEAEIRTELLDIGLVKSLRGDFFTQAHIALRDMIRDISNKVEISIPSFFDICAAESKTPLDTLSKAIVLRNDPDCRWFRKRFWQIVGAPPLQQGWRDELARISEKLVQRTEGRFWRNLREMSIAIRHCGLISYLIGGGALNTALLKLGSLLTNSADAARKRRELGPLSFLLRDDVPHATALGRQAKREGTATIDTEQPCWNAAERATLARYVIPTSPAVDRLIDKIRSQETTGIFRLDAVSLSRRLYDHVKEELIHYDYEPYSPSLPQRVRLPGSILRGSGGARVATCLDLTLLLAAGIEAGHAHPILIHLIHRSGDAHVIGACWRNSEVDPAVELPPSLVREWILSGSIEVFECTGVCQDPEFSCTYEEAQERALECLAARDWSMNFALNIFAARQHGLVPAAETRETM